MKYRRIGVVVKGWIMNKIGGLFDNTLLRWMIPFFTAECDSLGRIIEHQDNDEGHRLFNECLLLYRGVAYRLGYCY